ncbi:MAG: hypothetical protein GY749_27715 [Desulfobacteraceae bacterium]|nr:hypothetical protein [Desulfobacteraceae bacterium]
MEKKTEMPFRKIIAYSAVIILAIAVLAVFLSREKQQQHHAEQEKIVQGNQEDSTEPIVSPSGKKKSRHRKRVTKEKNAQTKQEDSDEPVTVFPDDKENKDQYHVAQKKTAQSNQKDSAEPVQKNSVSYTSRPVAVLLTSDSEAYTTHADDFINKIGIPSEVFNLYGDIRNADNVKDEILSVNPVLIFALGAKASYTAKTLTADHPDILVIFGMVMNWKKYKLHEQNNVVRIPYVVAPDIQFAYFKMFAPDVQQIGVIYSKMHSSEIIADAEHAAMLEELELVAEPIAESKDLRPAYNKIRDRIDAFWLIADPVVYTPKNMDWLKRQSIRDSIPCFGQSENIVKLGALLAVTYDDYGIGSEAASIAKKILFENESPKNIGEKYRQELRIFLNMKTAEKIGLEISQSAIRVATDIIE